MDMIGTIWDRLCEDHLYMVSPFLCLKNSKNELKNQAAEWIKMRAIFCAQG